MSVPPSVRNDGAAMFAFLDFDARLTKEREPNFDGDLAMLRYCKTGSGARLAVTEGAGAAMGKLT